jgi:hypothetical protein
MHLTISNQTQDDLRCSFRDSEPEDRVLLVKANAKSVIFAAKCSLLVVSRRSWNDETKEPEAVYTNSVSIPTAPRVNTSGRWNLVKVPPDSEWIVYRNKVRQCCRRSWLSDFMSISTSCLVNTIVYLFFPDAIHPVSCLLSPMLFLYHL